MNCQDPLPIRWLFGSLVDGVCACVCGVRCCVRGYRNQGLHWEEMHRSHVIAGDKYQNAAQRVVDALPKTLRAI